MADKMLDRISKLLNQAERADEGSPERDAFMEKAMVLSQAHSIDLAVARAHQANKEKVEEPERRTYKVGVRGERKPGKQLAMTPVARNAHMVDLFCAVAEANDLEVLINRDNTTCWALGFPSDHEVAEKMFTVLSVQMVAEADHRIKAKEHCSPRLVQATERIEIPHMSREWEEWDGRNRYYDINPEDYSQWQRDQVEREGGSYGWSEREGTHWRSNPHPPPKYREVPKVDEDGNAVMVTKLVPTTPAVDWRLNFYAGYTSRIAQRLRDAKARALKDAGAEDRKSEKGLALVDKKERLKKAEEEDQMYVLAHQRAEKGGGWEGSSVGRSWDHSAQTKGQMAANDAATGTERVVS